MCIVWIVVCCYLLASLFSTLLFWYENLNTSSKVFPALKPSLKECAVQYVSCLANYLLCTVLLILTPLLRPKTYQPDLPPVLLIHGLYSRRTVWTFLAWYLRKKGYAVFTVDYCSCGTPEAAVAKLDERIRQVEYTHGAPLCIAHSLGGVLLRIWMTRQVNQSRICGVISMATPHGGSKLAVLAPTAFGRMLQPGSALLTEMTRIRELTVPCLAMLNPRDQAILPLDAQLPPEGWTTRHLPSAGHFTMLFRRDIAQIVLEAIEVFAPAKPNTRPEVVVEEGAAPVVEEAKPEAAPVEAPAPAPVEGKPAEPVVEDVKPETAPEPEVVAEPVAEAIVEPVAKAVAEPEAPPVAEPMEEAVAESVVEAVVEPEAEAAAEAAPVVEPETAPAEAEPVEEAPAEAEAAPADEAEDAEDDAADDQPEEAEAGSPEGSKSGEGKKRKKKRK